MTLKLDLSLKDLTSLNGIELDINLQSLNLGDNDIEEIGVLSALTNLQKLVLQGNQIKEVGWLSSLTNLQMLNLSYNQIKEIGGLSSLTNLKVLNLGENKIKEIGGLSSLTNLQYLFLSNNQIPNWREKKDRLLQRNKEIQWKVVKPQFIRYCFTLAPLNLPVDILIMIFDVNSYPNHLYKKWEIGKTIKDEYNKYHNVLKN
jgi:hypothetical protein